MKLGLTASSKRFLEARNRHNINKGTFRDLMEGQGELEGHTWTKTKVCQQSAEKNNAMIHFNQWNMCVSNVLCIFYNNNNIFPLFYITKTNVSTIIIIYYLPCQTVAQSQNIFTERIACIHFQELGAF